MQLPAFLRKRWRLILDRSVTDLRRARELYAGDSEVESPANVLLVRKTGLALMVFCVILGAWAMLVWVIAGRLALPLIGLSAMCAIGGVFQLVSGRPLRPEKLARPDKHARPEKLAREHAASLSADTSECPNCGRLALGSGESHAEHDRVYVGMRCAHCANVFWLYRAEPATTNTGEP